MKRLLPLLALAVCAAVMVAATAPKSNTQLGTGSIAGLITDSVTGQPIAGATVTAGCCGGYSAVTGNDGHYVIENVPAGDYPVRAVKAGVYAMKMYPTAVHVGDGQAVTGIDIALAPAGGSGGNGSISGVVQDVRNGAPIAGVKVTAGCCCRGASALTGSDGTYTITGLADGSYTVKAMKSGWLCATYPTPVVIANGQPVMGINFQLSPRVFSIN